MADSEFNEGSSSDGDFQDGEDLTKIENKLCHIR